MCSYCPHPSAKVDCIHRVLGGGGSSSLFSHRIFVVQTVVCLVPMANYCTSPGAVPFTGLRMIGATFVLTIFHVTPQLSTRKSIFGHQRHPYIVGAPKLPLYCFQALGFSMTSCT